jgi:hypothetical protein
MEKVLNFDSDVVNFLCFDQPIVIRVIAIMFINGCSIEVNLSALSDICPREEKPRGETKYNIKPISN